MILGLQLALPGRWTDGYVLDADTGRPLRYRLNGLPVSFATVALYAGACWLSHGPLRDECRRRVPSPIAPGIC